MHCQNCRCLVTQAEADEANEILPAAETHCPACATRMAVSRMDHETAFALVAEHAPGQAGRLWNTTNHTGCDTANAVADQYDASEVDQAIADLKTLADGETPEGWEAA